MISHSSPGGSMVTVWTISLDGPDVSDCSHMLTRLSSAEQARATRFHRAADRRRYTLAHVGLREILSKELGVPPSSIRFEQNANGKPRVSQNADASQLEFSLSHSGDVAMIGLSRSGSIGVDIERIDSDTGVLAIAERCFSKQEWEMLQSISESERLTHFFQLWVCKEAYVKGRGEGIIDRLRSFTISLDQGEPQLVQDDHDPDAPRSWKLHLLDAPEGFVAALATHNDIQEVTQVGWPLPS